MRRIVYKSEETTTITLPILTEIVNKARTFNKNLEVTGMLIFNNKSFLQAIEGNDSEIDKVMQRVQASPEHHNIIILLDEKTDERYFPEWYMGLDCPVERTKNLLYPRLFPLPDPNEISTPGVAELVLKLYARNKLPVKAVDK